MNKELIPYYEKAKSAYYYNEHTGVFSRKNNINRMLKKGECIGSIGDKGYAETRVSINGKSKRVRLHVLAIYIKHGYTPMTIDHINGIKHDNRIANLRLCTQKQNTHNRGASKISTTKVKGVSFRSDRGKYSSSIWVEGKRLHLYEGEDFEYACFVRTEAEKKYHGEFMYKEKEEAMK